MKAVWRHVRLSKGFVNREAAPYGGVKLRIPHVLFMEKMRTQTRFNVNPMRSQRFDPRVLKRARRQMMRMGQPAAKDRKQTQNASHKIFQVVRLVLLPLLSARLPDRVSFRPEVSCSAQLLDFLRSVNPSCLEDKASFLRFCESLFDSWHPP